MIFRDRSEAGLLLASKLAAYRDKQPVVVALPRGGVPVAAEVARALDAPLDILVVRKIGAPGNPEYAIGAITEDGIPWINADSVYDIGISRSELERAIEIESRAVKDKSLRLRGGAAPIPTENRTVILIDDGLATGATATASIRLLRKRNVKEIILAIPVCAAETVDRVREEVDDIVCLEVPLEFGAVGFWYENFSQVSDETVMRILSGFRPRVFSTEADISDGIIHLPATLTLQEDSKGLVIFSHGSGSSRKSPRNIQVAWALNQAGLSTLLFDLLTPQESMDRENVFDIPLLARRLMLAVEWSRKHPVLRSLPKGFFGASTGAASALWAAADLGTEISAIVSRGGRPDLAESRLSDVIAPTLLIVGGRDELVLELNRMALEALPRAELSIVANATHLFEEPGALEEVSELARNWFINKLGQLWQIETPRRFSGPSSKR